MKDLIILGSGVHGAEMAEIVERVNRAKKTWRLLGFLSPDEKGVGAERNGYKVLGTKDNLADYPNAFFVPDNEWPRSTPVPRAQLVSLVDPSTFVSRTAAIGAACVFYPHCYIGLNARVGDYVFSLAGSVINHDDVVEDRSVLASGVTLAGGVHVEADCYIGQSSTVRQNITIGKGSLIGMGAVVVKDVPPNCVMVGNPACKLKERT